MKEIEKSIKKFDSNKSVMDLKNKIKEKNFLDIMSISNRETSHSSFICWLLNYEENYDLEAFPLKLFLKLILDIDNNNTEIDKDLKRDLQNELETKSLKIGVGLSDIKTERKVGENGRIDIILKFLIKYKGHENNEYLDYVNILIENKVKSKEHNCQTKKYEEHACEVPAAAKRFVKNKKGINLFVYLSPSKEEKYSPESEKFIHISYQELLNRVIEPSYNQTKNERVKFILQEYINNLGITNNIVMALGSEDKKILEKFWNDNQDLIKLALEARLLNDELSESDKDKTNEMIDLINKDKIGKYVRKTIEDYLKEGILSKEDIDNLTDKTYSNENFGISEPVLLEVSDGEKKDRYWKGPIDVNNKKYVICSEWYEKMRDKFNDWKDKVNN